MNTNELQEIEVFRQQLEFRFRRDRTFERAKLIVGVVATSLAIAAIPLLVGLRQLSAPGTTDVLPAEAALWAEMGRRD